MVVSPFRFRQPFFAFRPRFFLGFGLWAGFPVAYPFYAYSYPYSYGYPYASPYGYPYPPPSPYPYPYSSTYPYGYSAYDPGSQPYPASGYPPPASGSVGVQADQNVGGVSLDITPTTASVVVDGTSVGTVAEFSSTSMPLTLAPGRHHVEVRAPGYQTMEFDVEIVAGQVTPYRGEMQR
jgi:hypothetical protein